MIMNTLQESVANPPITNRRVLLLKLFSNVKHAKKIFGIDWLQIHLRFNQRVMSEIDFAEMAMLKYGEIYKTVKYGDLGLVIRNAPTKMFLGMTEIYLDGVLIAKGMGFARNGINGMTEKTAIIKFENEYLYQTNISEVINPLINAAILEELPKIVRLDTFIDLQVNLCSELWDYLKKSKSDADFVLMYNPNIKLDGWDTSAGSPKTITLGSISTGKQICIYDKTEEIQVSGKSYISKLHKSIFGSNKEHVFRIEARASGDYFKEIDVTDNIWERIKEVAEFSFYDIIKTKLTFLEISATKKRRYWQKWLIPIAKNISEITRQPLKRNEPIGKWFMKIMLKRYWQSLITSNLSEFEMLEMCKRIGEHIQHTWMHDYFMEKEPIWTREVTIESENVKALKKQMCLILAEINKQEINSALEWLRQTGLKAPQDTDIDLLNFPKPDIYQAINIMLDNCPF